MKRGVTVFVLGVFFLLCSCSFGFASLGLRPENKIALVVGNMSYGEKMAKFKLVENDVKAMEEFLKRSGFNVTKLVNATYPQFVDVIDRFNAEEADVKLIYYSGAGLTACGGKYLVPIGYQLPDSMNSENPSVNIEQSGLVGIHSLFNNSGFERGDYKFVFLDTDFTYVDSRWTCSENYVHHEIVPNVLVVFSAEPDQLSRLGTLDTPSQFTQQLITVLSNKEDGLENLMRKVRAAVSASADQNPWYISTLTSERLFFQNKEEKERIKGP